jgi:hypothetical protein
MADPISTANSAVSHITGAIRQAAQKVGTSFSYLLATAKVESNLNPDANATTSSAKGLFQFIDQTWLTTMKEAGPKLGLGNYANAITQSPDGRMDVTDPAVKSQILGLRQDPKINAAMAGAFTNKNASILRSNLGRSPTDGELYIAHFLGPGGANKLIDAARTTNPPATILFPGAAAANRSVFYDKAGRARLASEVYANLTGRYETARAGTSALAGADAAPAVALRSTIAEPVRVATVAPVTVPPIPVPLSEPAAVSDPAGTTMAYAASQPGGRLQGETGPVFYALFHTGERREAVSPRVNQLWNAPPAAGAASPAEPPVAQVAANGGTLGLFQDVTPNIRGLFTGSN